MVSGHLRQYRYWSLLAALLCICFGLRTSAQAGQNITSCGTYSGLLILQADITGDTCITISAANSTLNGNGHTITVTNPIGHAVYAVDKGFVTVHNLTSNSDIYLNGDGADNALVENNVLGGVNITSGDDAVIRNNLLGSLTIGQPGLNAAQRHTISNNTITGTANKLVAINGSGETPCPATSHTLLNNTITSTQTCLSGVPAGTPGRCDEPMALWLWCAAGNIINGNIIRTTDQSMGLRLRDESDNNLIIGNTIWVSAVVDGDFGGINITSGNNGRHHPQNNTFSYNIVRSDNDLALNIQSPGTSNRFNGNLFWSNTDGNANWLNDGPYDNGWDHNTFYNAGTGPVATFDYRTDRTTDQFTDNIFATNGSIALNFAYMTPARYGGDDNLFWSANSATTFGTYGTLANWQTQFSPDDAHATFGNPLFVDPANGDFQLQATSPARGTGSNGSDIGAYPYQAVGCTENWSSCTAWSPCSNGSQARICTDANHCGTIVGRPPIVQSCTVIDTTSPARVVNLSAG